MISRKINELAVDIDDASTIVEELATDDCDGDKLAELQTTLEHAKDIINEIDNGTEKNAG